MEARQKVTLQLGIVPNAGVSQKQKEKSGLAQSGRGLWVRGMRLDPATSQNAMILYEVFGPAVSKRHMLMGSKNNPLMKRR
jgi:hypothetical protein